MEQIDPTLQHEILSRLDAVAAKLGIATEHLWGIFTQQAAYEGTIELIVLLAFILLGPCLLHRGYKAIMSSMTAQYHDRTSKQETQFGFGVCMTIIGGMIVLATCLCTAIDLSDIITKISNPEYHAWLEIKGIIG